MIQTMTKPIQVFATGAVILFLAIMLSGFDFLLPWEIPFGLYLLGAATIIGSVIFWIYEKVRHPQEVSEPILRNETNC